MCIRDRLSFLRSLCLSALLTSKAVYFFTLAQLISALLDVYKRQEHRRIHKVKGVCLNCKLIDTVADGRQLPHYLVELWVWLLTEPIPFDHCTE